MRKHEAARSPLPAASRRRSRQFRAVAQVLSDCQDPESARICLLKALERFPGKSALLADVARTEFHVNRVDDAEEHLATLLRIDPFHAGALHLRSTLRTQTPERNHIADLEQRLARASLACRCRHFALAKEYEDLQQYDNSFAALIAGQSLRGTLRYDSQRVGGAPAIRRSSPRTRSVTRRRDPTEGRYSSSVCPEPAPRSSSAC